MRSTVIVRAIILATAAILAQPAVAQNIGVSVDGVPVTFRGARPQSIQGRVLVPLRGVLEQMGAFVDWVPATRTVLAQRGDRDVALPVGSRTATVNGQAVTLDVPATIIAGTTMVPLRFLGEALGVDVRWNATTRTVEIVSGESGAATPPPGQGLQITGISHNAANWLTKGSVLEVTMEGTSGGTATFEIPGVVSQVQMREVTPGRYVGTWTVPANAKSISGASLIAALKVGNNQQLIQAAVPIRVDAAAPLVRNQLPEPNSTVAETRPNISAVFDDAAGSGINTSSVKMTVNGVNVTPSANVTQSFVSYRPTAALPAGENSVTLSVSDRASNTTQVSWKFSVRSATDIVKSFTFTAPEAMQAGDIVTVTMEAAPGGRASFEFVTPAGQHIRPTAMQEVSAGRYQGEYTIRRNEDLRGSSVVGTFTTAAGESFNVTATGTVGGTQTSALVAPTITSPKEGAAVASPLTITGRAPANSQVRLHIDYVTTVLGALQMNGVLSEQVVTANASGAFTSEPIDLGTLIKGKNTQYTLTAVTIAADGKESDPATVIFTRS